MNLLELTELLGNVGEFLGSLAVLMTLVYLAIQVRQSKALIERSEKIALSQVHQSRAAARIELSLAQVSSDFPDRLIGFWGWNEIPEGLSERELHIARNIFNANAVLIDNALYQRELGLMDADMYENARRVIAKNFKMWDALGVLLTPRIRECYLQSQKEVNRAGA